jgi:hypothetical protein
MRRHTNLCMKSRADTGRQKSLGGFCAARSTRSRQSTVDGWAAHRTRADFNLRDRPPVRHQIRQFDIADDQGSAIGRQRLTALPHRLALPRLSLRVSLPYPDTTDPNFAALALRIASAMASRDI